MAAITWRNVDGPSLEGVSNIYRAASEGMNSSLGILDRMLQNRNAIQAANWDAEKANNTEAFKTAVSAATTPEELAAMQPKLQEMAKGFDGKVDPAVLRDYATTHLNALRTQGIQAYEHGKVVRTQATAADREAYDLAMANGDVARATQIAAERDLGPDEATRVTAATEALRQRTRQQAADVRADELAPKQHQATLTTLEDQATASRISRQVKQIEGEAAQATQAHRARQDTMGQTLGAIGKEKGLPVDNQGRLRIDLLTSEQYDWLDKVVASQLPPGFKGPNILREYEGGDTKAADTFVNGLNGKYDPAVIEQSRQALRSQFNTDAGQTAIGREANNAARLAAQSAVADAEAKASNWYAPGSKNAMSDYAVLSAELPKLIDTTTGIDAEEDVRALESFIHEMATKGIDVGKGKMVTPSINDLRSVIRSAEGGWFKDSTRANNARDALMELVRTSYSAGKIKEAEEIQVRDRKRAVDALLKAK